MATLQKIRSKSVLVLIIIGAGLLAFVIGDFFTSGRTLFGTGSTIAKVDGTSIDVQEFQRNVEQAAQQAQASGRKVDYPSLQQQVLSNMVGQVLFKNEFDKLGLTVTDSELSNAMLGTGAPVIDRMVQQQVGVPSASQLHDMAFNPAKYGVDEQMAVQLRSYWMSLEQQTEQMLLNQKFQTLFLGTLVANELDAKQLYDENLATSHVAFARKSFSSLPDNDERFAVTPQELEQQWQKNKQDYALSEPVRMVSYINVEITPSQADVTAAEQRVENAIADLNEKADLEGIADYTDFVADRHTIASQSIADERIKQFADSAAAGRAALVSRVGNDFTLAKVFGRSNQTDSVLVDIVNVQGSKEAMDSVMTAMNNGTKLNDMSTLTAVANGNDSIWLSLLDPQVAQFKDRLSSAALGTVVVADTASAATQNTLIRVRNRRAPVSVVDLAVVSFSVEPSVTTVNALQDKLQKYVAEHKTAAAFADSAAAAGYQAIPARVSDSTPLLNGIPDTRNVVAWALDAKKGSVSGIFGNEQTGRFVAAALDDVYKDFTPVSDPQVKAILTAEVRNNKKAEFLISEYAGKGKTVAEYAKAMGVDVDSATVNFGQINIFNPGFAGAEVAGVVSVTPKGKTVGPMKGNTGVLVVEVTDVDTEGRPYEFREASMQYARTLGPQSLAQNITAVLLGNKKVQNNIYKFFRE